MTANLVKRSDVTFRIRQVLHEEGFLEVETPILTKSTPEGARDFLVPSRVHTGEFYAASPVAAAVQAAPDGPGIERYYQMARWLPGRGPSRPTGSRVHPGRPGALVPEEETVFALVERIFAAVFPVHGSRAGALPRMTHAEAMERFGVDRPDTRYRPRAEDARSLHLAVGDPPGGRDGEGDRRSGGAAFARKRLDDLEVSAKQLGASGLVWVKLQSDLPGGFNSNAKKLLDEATVAAGGRGALGEGRRPPPRRGGEEGDRRRRPRHAPVRLAREEKLIPEAATTSSG